MKVQIMEQLKITRKVLKRLAFIKYLFNQGIDNSQKEYPFSSISILNFHDSIEFFLGLVAEELGAKKPYSVIDYFKEVSNAGIKLAHKTKFDKLNDLRRELKHKGIIPTQDQIDECTDSAVSFFEENVNKVFGISFNEIDLIDLIDNGEIKNHLKKAAELFEEKDLVKSFAELAHGFWKMIHTFEEKTKLRGSSAFYFGRDMTFLNSFHMRLDFNKFNSVRSFNRYRSYQNNDFDPLVTAINDLSSDINNGISETNKRVDEIQEKFRELSKFVDAVQESTQRMQSAIKIISLGLNYSKYTFFNAMTPSTVRTLGGEYRFDYSRDFSELNITKKDFDVCVEFIIESYFQLENNKTHITRLSTQYQKRYEKR